MIRKGKKKTIHCNPLVCKNPLISWLGCGVHKKEHQYVLAFKTSSSYVLMVS